MGGNGSLALVVCSSYAREFEAVINGGGFKGVDLRTFEPVCATPGPIDIGPLTGAEGSVTRAIGGMCLRQLDPGGVEGVFSTNAMPYCFEMLAGPRLAEKLVAEGAYVVTSGWLRDWRGWMEKGGFDRETAGMFFGECAEKIVLLDSGVDDFAADNLREMAEFVGLPCDVVPVGLDYLRGKVTEAVRAMRSDLTGDIDEVGKLRGELSAAMMSLDFMQELADLDSERVAVDKTFMLFEALFAPERIVYVPLKDGVAGEIRYWPPGVSRVVEAERTNVRKFGKSGEIFDGGFSIWVTQAGREVGAFLVEGVAFPEYIESYMNTAMALTKVLGLCIRAAARKEERNAAVAELAANREWLLTTLKSIGDGVIATDSRGRVTFLNNVAEELTGWTNAEAEGRGVTEVFKIINEESRKTVKSPVEKVLEEKKIVYLENHTILICKDGAERHIADSGAPIFAGGGVAGTVLVFRDVSAERKIEAEKESLQRQLMHSQKMESLGVLAGGIAHEFNNMLSVIMGASDLLLEALPEGAEGRDDAMCILESARRSRELTLKLLSFARRDKLSMARVRAGDLMREAAGLAVKSSRARINVTVDERTEAAVQVDRNQLMQSLLNVCNNACDAMPDGGELTLKCSGAPEGFDERRGGKFIVLEVSDTGSGMPPEVADKIFDPFFTTKTAGRGTGLGMAITERIVKGHGGDIRIDSAPGRGTTVRIFLPEAEGVAAEEKPSVRAVPAGGNETVLLVDDESLLLMLCEKMLMRAGYKTIKAERGVEAIEHFRKHADEISLVVLDMVMPDMGGSEVFKEMKRIRPDVKIMIASGYSEDGAITELLESGAAGFLQKPYTPVELREKVRQALDAAAIV